MLESPGKLLRTSMLRPGLICIQSESLKVRLRNQYILKLWVGFEEQAISYMCEPGLGGRGINGRQRS